MNNYFQKIVPLLLNKNNMAGGSDSLSYYYLFSLFVGPIGLFFKETRKWFWFYIVGVIVMLTFTIYLFEKNFLSRYFIASPAILFVYSIFLIDTILRKFIKKSSFYNYATALITVSVFLGVVIWGPLHGFTKDLLNEKWRLSYLLGRNSTEEILSTYSNAINYEFVSKVNNSLGPDEKVIINDGMLLFYTGLVLNLHALHSDYIRFDQVDVEQLTQILIKQNVKYAIIKSGISGLYPVLKQYLNREMSLIDTKGAFQLYQIRN